MARLNYKRLIIGTVAGALAWSLWTSIVTMSQLLPAYRNEQQLGHMLAIPRFGFGLFFAEWLLMVVTVSAIVAWSYARFQSQLGSRFKAALVIGGLLGFLVSVPIDLSVITWNAVSPSIPMAWTLDAWVGVVLATGVVALVYRESRV